MLLSVFVVILLGEISSHTTRAHLGVDVSTPVSYKQFMCLKGKGYNAVIVRTNRNNESRTLGEPNYSAYEMLWNAHNARFYFTDVYFSSCPICPLTAVKQIRRMGRFTVSTN